MFVEDCIALLGCRAKDKVTGFSGVISSVGFDLYGCVQCIVTPPMDEKGEPKAGHWFDVNRVEVFENDRVMGYPKYEFYTQAPSNYNKGPADKPNFERKPLL